jgi:hypothetical protein
MGKDTLKKIKGRNKYDWQALKQKFFNSDITEAYTFIRVELGCKKGLDNNIRKHIKGWTNEKKLWKQKRWEEIQKKVDEALAEKLKTNLEELLITKRLLYSLDAKYLEVLAKMSDKKNPPTEEELRFFKNYKDNLKGIFKRVQTELGLPISLEDLKEKNGNH